MMQALRQQVFLLSWVVLQCAFIGHCFTPKYVHHARMTRLTTTANFKVFKLPEIQRRPGLLNSLKSENYENPNELEREIGNIPDELLTSLDKVLDKGNLREAVRLVQQVASTSKGVALPRQLWNKIFDAIEERTTNAEENSENLRRLGEAAEFPVISAARSEMTDMYAALKQMGQLALYGSLDARLPLAAGSNNVPPSLLETILGLPMKALTPQPTNALLLAGVTLAVAEGLLSMFAGISLNVLVVATLFLITCDRLFLNGASFESFIKFFSPGVQEKILKHEAGHFLAAYLLGCPVEGIVLDAWSALRDKRFGARGSAVSAGTSFFDPQLSQQINLRQSVTRSAIDRYSIIVMAGIAAEADSYGRADGGAGDEMSLVAFLTQLNAQNSKSARAGKMWNYEAIRNQARWGALQAVLLLREYKPAYHALVDALERGGSLGDCIYAIEEAARNHNLKPLEEPLGYLIEQGGPMGKEVVWMKYQDMEASSAALKLAFLNGGPAGATMDNTAVQSLKPETAASLQDEEDMSATLQQYREKVEARLREVERKLQELEQ